MKTKNNNFKYVFILTASILLQFLSCNKPERTVLEKIDPNNVTGISAYFIQNVKDLKSGL